MSLMAEFPNFDEAIKGPSSHQCGGEIVEVYAHSGEIALVCFWCDVVWFTGLQETQKVRFVSTATLIAAADARYPAAEIKNLGPCCFRCGRRNVEFAAGGSWCKYCKADYMKRLRIAA